MIHYFIDLENVHDAGFDGIEQIKEPAIIHVIGSGQTKSILFSTLAAACQTNVSWRFELAENGKKNSLDIQLGVKLGLSIAQSPKDTFRVISKDMGYISAVKYLQEQGYDVKQSLNIRGDACL